MRAEMNEKPLFSPAAEVEGIQLVAVGGVEAAGRGKEQGNGVRVPVG